MGEDLQPEIPSPDDAEAPRSCLDRTSSASSSLAVDSSNDFSRSDADVAPSHVEWTDERHRSYLNSLEASFVKQLHSSLGLLGWRSRGNMETPNSSHKMPIHTSHSSEQFTVLRDGCWQRISFQRNQLSDKTVDSNVSIDSPWISRLRSAGKHQMSTSSDFQKHINEKSRARNSTSSNDLSRNSGKRSVNHSCHQDLVGSNTAEVSDQNFVDGDKVNGSSCTSRAKRLKTDAVDSSSNDQIVPNPNRFYS